MPRGCNNEEQGKRPKTKSKAKGKTQKPKGKAAGSTNMLSIEPRFRHSIRRAIGRSRALLPLAFCALPFAIALSLAVLLNAQTPEQTPYAAIDRDAVNYHGPGREDSHDLGGKEIPIGLLLPLTGARQAEGEALRRAAQMAVDEENAAASAGSSRLQLVARDESGPWGQASAQVVHLVFDDRAVAIITSTEGGSAHLAEQVGNKVGVPILTLSSDSTITEIDLPWIFRIGPADTAQAQLFARDIYQNRKLERVLLLTQDDHDGRLGAQEFIKAARTLSFVAPAQIVVDAASLGGDAILEKMRAAQALVVWTDAATAQRIAEQMRQLHVIAPLYCSRKAAASETGGASRSNGSAAGHADANKWIAQSPAAGKTADEFRRRYRERFGSEPGIGPAEAYDAVRILAASLRKSGPNRARLRDVLDDFHAYAGASGAISFDHAGNDTAPITLVHLD